MENFPFLLLLFPTIVLGLPAVYVDALLKYIPKVSLLPVLKTIDRKVEEAIQAKYTHYKFYNSIIGEYRELEQSIGKLCKEPECLRISDLVIEAMEVEFLRIQTGANESHSPNSQSSFRSFILVQMQFLRILQRRFMDIHLFFRLRSIINHIMLHAKLCEQLLCAPSIQSTILELSEERYVSGMKSWIRSFTENSVNRLGFTIPSSDMDDLTEWYKKATKQRVPILTSPHEMDIFIETLVQIPLEAKFLITNNWKKHKVTILINLSYAHQRLLELRASIPRSAYIFFEEKFESIYKAL